MAKLKRNDPCFILKNASKYQLEGCLIGEGWESNGLANILIVRKNNETNKYLLGVLLVDTYCLGVKNVMFDVDVDKYLVDRLIEDLPYKMVEADYEYCRGLILGAIDFARSVGFEPHDEWEDVKEFVEPDREYKTKHKFGKKGKPFYIAGPDDDVDKIIEILGGEVEIVLP
ncbi:hypothetical protein KJ764_05945 [Patescibacteria group bacterium]|nr:hypothetical protein [Patescibacteria group bacterium]